MKIINVFQVCALQFDHQLSVDCNSIGYPKIDTCEVDKKTIALNNKLRARTRTEIHQWICIRDIIEGLITTNNVLKTKTVSDILNKIDLWLKQRKEADVAVNSHKIDRTSFKANARQIVWDLMELK